MPEADRTPIAGNGSRDGYAPLHFIVRQQGLLRLSPLSTLLALVVNAVLWMVAWSALVVVGNSWYALFVALLFAFVSVQSAFVVHDAGHRQLSRTPRRNDVIGFVQGNLLLGMSYGLWVEQHNRHHRAPNCLGDDPATSIATLAFTPDQAREKRGLTRPIVRYQAYLFFPMLLLEGAYILGQGVRAVLRRRVRHPLIEGILISLHWFFFAGAILSVLAPARAALFAATYLGVGGLHLSLVFAPNHKGMPVLDGETKMDHLRTQVMTARNVRGGLVADLVFGGLNYQIEHHLFPRMPRKHLRRARPIVQAFCADYGIGYHETTFRRSVREILRYLHEVSKPLREPCGVNRSISERLGAEG